ncbi:MAG: right-handed parallel beta-helix repeat-containing protein, partial [Bacilli bacterium]|nr:right-handed parallel beta-helix repeat-containing protein [Bacilli bacterium]
KNVGGILGMGYTADIEDCAVEDCVIVSEGKRAAGIAANMPSDGSIKDCVSKNNVITASGSGTNGPADIITYCTAGTTLSGNTFEGNELISYYEVTPENAQDVLNGKLGSINNAVIQLTPGVYQDLEFGMPTADADNGVTCHFNGFNTTAMTVAEFLADPNCGKPGYNSYYEREIKNLTIKGCEGAVIKNIKSGAGHYYDNTGVGNYDAVRGLTLQGSAYYLNHKYSNIAFENIDFEGYNDFETSMKDTLIDGMSFKGCTFKNSPSNKQALRIHNEWTHDTLVQTIKNVVVENCQFNNVYQGVYTGGVYGVTVKNSSFDGLTHNAIAVQNNGAAEFDHGKVWIEGNTFKNGADRLIRFNKVGADTQITIKNNTATECGDADGQVIKATSVNAAVTIACSGNNWGKKGTVTAYAVAPFADVAD